MSSSIDLILVVILFSTLLTLVTSRMMALIRLMALQGLFVSLVPVLLANNPETGALFFSILMILVKAVLIPALLYTAVTRVSIRREVEPLIGYHASLVIGLGLMLLSVQLTARLGLSLSDTHSLALIAAFTTISCGLFLMMSRAKAVTQVIGYLILENGIYMIGATLNRQTHNHYIVEFGILLDLLVAVMLMGIILHNINRTFDDVDTHQLEQLKD
ncbi:hydrogenase [Desulfococcaceae bacterium OttesenSCG-928-F15]|nr:hydrogenase [Desulfococcaceae bacterium OttesenSCG-928-F15]